MRLGGSARQINSLWHSRWEPPAMKRRGGSGERGSVALPPHVNSGTDPAIYSARKISGRPCVPGRLWKNRAPADSLRRAREGKKGRTKEGKNPEGPEGALAFLPSYRLTFILWAALPGFPPTQGLPEIFRWNGTDRSEADAPREEKGTTRPFPEGTPNATYRVWEPNRLFSSQLAVLSSQLSAKQAPSGPSSVVYLLRCLCGSVVKRPGFLPSQE